MSKCGCGDCVDCLNKKYLEEIGLSDIFSKTQLVEITFIDKKKVKGVIKYNKDNEIVFSDGKVEDTLCNILEFILYVNKIGE